MTMKAAPDGQDDRSAARRRRGSGHGVMMLVMAMLLASVAGFVWFVAQMHSDEQKPPRHADGIVVLTGGSSRVSDAMDLLARGYGKRLLISGVHRANGASDILRTLPDSEALLACCVDLDRSAINTRSNATQTRRWVAERGFRSLIVVTSNYHMPRATVELTDAMPDIDLIFYPVIGDKWRDEPWWESGAALRLLLSEYVKYVAAEVRVRLAHLGVDLLPEDDGPAVGGKPAKPTTAQVN